MTRLGHAARLVVVLALAFVGGALPAEAAAPSQERTAKKCVRPAPASGNAAGRSMRWQGTDHRALDAAQQRRISARTHRLLSRRADVAGLDGRRRARRAAGTIPVYVHVMAGEGGRGNVGNGRIADQIAMLNTAFAGAEAPGVAADTGIRFGLADVDRYQDAAWHRDRESTSYRARTRRGGARALNVWVVGFGDLGVATFPWDYARSPKVDGVRVHHGSLPGGELRSFDRGKTLVHEVGHWLGLYHTFQGGCTDLNDEVPDTAAQSVPTEGCPPGQDSCGLPGVDPVHNYMDYSNDDCYSEFSPGQAVRMQQMLAAYRG